MTIAEMCAKLKNVEAIQHIHLEKRPGPLREGTLGALDRATNAWWQNQVATAPTNPGTVEEAFRTLQRQMVVQATAINVPLDYRRNP